MSTPGAPRSTERTPVLEKYASESLLSVAATARTSGRSYEAGYVGVVSLFVPSFPAAATNKELSWSATLIASASACEYEPPAHELFITSAPFCAAYSTALTASAVVPEPCALRNLTGMIRTFQFTPATPTPLLPAAPIVPATCVPWPWSSIGLLSPLTKSQPCQS